MKTLTWNSCYDLSWKGFITPASFAHPAKMARGLLERIIAHGFEKGYWQENSLIGDCFGGVGTTGIIGAYHGLRVVSVELEPRFVSLARRNYALHSSKWKALGSPRPVILQGDSRAFHVLVGKADAMVSSPPYAVISTGAGGLNTKPARILGWVVRNRTTAEYWNARLEMTAGEWRRPYFKTEIEAAEAAHNIAAKQDRWPADYFKPHPIEGQSGRSAKAASQDTDQKYGQAAGQIAALKEGSVDSVVASPPYAGSVHDGNGIDASKLTGNPAGPNSQAGNEGYGQSPGQIGALKSGSVDGVVSSPPYVDGLGHGGKSPACEKLAAEKQHPYHVNGAYGESPGQIERLASGEVSAVLTSPPWENNSEGSRKGSKIGSPEKILACRRGHGASDSAVLAQAARDEQKIYGDSPGQIGKLSGGADYLNGQTTVGPENYWMAMSKVYKSCFQAIRPGGILCLVLKDYVKAGKRVPLCDDTVRLIEHIGFQMVERVHAMLVKETVHADLFGADTKQTTSRKSFFRRLAEKKGSPAIDYEEVLFARKPL